MPRWTGPRLTPAQLKLKKRLYDQARKAKRRNEVRPAQLEESTTRYAPLLQLPTTLTIPGPAHGLKIAVLADAQVKPGVAIDHLPAYGRYLAEIRPDVIECIGDFADMGSLSTYDAAGSLGAENQRYREDIRAARAAMTAFLTPIRKVKGWTPELVMTLGNHEDRIDRAVAANPRQLQGVMSVADLGYEEDGWKVYPFLQPVTINGVVFCHYMPSGQMGRPITTARALLTKMHMSCVVGHQQGRDIAYSKRADGSGITGIIAGSFYQHDENYLSPFTNQHWRGTYVLNAVKDGSFDEMAISVEYLLRKYT